MRYHELFQERPRVQTCDNCGLSYYPTLTPHVCAPWTGQKSTSPPEQPAPEGGEWEYVGTFASAEVVIGSLTLRPHWTGLANGQDIRTTMKQIVTDHARAALVPGLVEALAVMLQIVEEEGHADNYVPQVTAARAALAAVAKERAS